MPLDRVRVYSFSQDRFTKALRGDQPLPPRKRDISLAGYLATIGVVTIVEEQAYVDKDYLEDFKEFYVACFHPYRKECRRLHFFSDGFTEEQFEGLLNLRHGELTEKKLKGAYKGFLVVRPLPQAPIGRTCVKHYRDDEEGRSFPAAIPCRANLCGIDLEVRSVPYQEQDRVTSACATSAIWSTLQVSGKRFHHAIPSPVSITKTAVMNSPSREGRGIPNDGLVINEMVAAVRNVGLDPIVIKTVDQGLLKEIAYAYSGIKIPTILGVRLFDAANFELFKKKDGKYRVHAQHAITICGFGVGAGSADTKDPGFRAYARRIGRFFAHDDQVVPFAKVDCHDDKDSLEIPGWDGKFVTPTAAIIPIYHKIRVPFLWVRGLIGHVNKALCAAGVHSGFEDIPGAVRSLATTVEWDIRLFCSNDYKAELLSSGPSQGAVDNPELLSRSSPRFLWKATAKSGTETIADVLFDATDFVGGENLFDVVHRSGLSRDLFAAAKIVFDKKPNWAGLVPKEALAVIERAASR